MTHVVDFATGSAALAIAVVGACQYERVAANDVHCEWLNSTLDRCVMYMAGKDKQFAKGLGGDSDCMEKVGQYLGGTMMEARRMLEPLAGEGAESQSEDSSDDA